MIRSIASMNQRHGTLTQGIDHKRASMPAQLSTYSAPTKQEPARSFIAVLLSCLSAFNA